VPQADQALLFGINHTDNRFFGAALADELGDQLVHAKPKFFFPPDWVLERAQGSAGVAEFAVTYCDCPDTLGTIARRERRIGVTKVLAENKHLRDADYAIMLDRIRDESHRREIARTRRGVVGAPAYEAAVIVAAGPTLDQVMGQVASGECDHNPLDRLFETEAEQNQHGAVARYIAASYVYAKDSEVWATSTYSPSAALALYPVQEQAAVLSDLISSLDSCNEQCAPLGLDMVELLIACGLVVKGPSNSYAPRYIFSEEAADVLLEVPGWVSFLRRQLLSEAQFERMLEVSYEATLKREFFSHLHGSRERLVKFLEHMSTATDSKYWIGGDLDSALACISDSDDPLTFEMVQRSSEYEIRRYVEGSCKVGPSRQVTLPTLEQLLALYEQSPESFEHVGYALTQNSYAYNDRAPLDETYVDMLIDNVPGLALSLLGSPKYGDQLYARLMGLGVTEEQVVDAFRDAKNLSLKSVIAALVGDAE
jgi:hypothetical protein